MPDAGLTLSQQPPLSPLVEIHANDTAHRLWRQIALDDSFQREFVTVVDDLIGDLDHRTEREERLQEVGVTALGGVYAGMVPSLAHADAEFFKVLRQNAQFGTPGRSVAGWHVDFEEVADGPLAVLQESDRTPTIAVRIDDGFGELRAEYREDIVWLLAELTRAVDLRIVATGRWQRRLAREYREHLPAVSEQCSAGLSENTITQRVETAHDVLIPTAGKSASSTNSPTRRLKPSRTTNSTHSTRSRRELSASASPPVMTLSPNSDSSKRSRGPPQTATRSNYSLPAANTRQIRWRSRPTTAPQGGR